MPPLKVRSTAVDIQALKGNMHDLEYHPALRQLQNLAFSPTSQYSTTPQTRTKANHVFLSQQRMFQSGQVYSALMYFFLIGPVVTILVYLLYRRHPNSWLKYINVPIFFNAAGNIPPANTTQYSLWFIFGFVFNFLIRRKAFEWWKKYNYLTQAAMDTGTALATVVIFFALSYHGVKLKWWGNEVGGDTDDANSVPWLKVAKGAHFGKGPGEF